MNKSTHVNLTALDSNVNAKAGRIFFPVYESYRTSRDGAATGDSIDCPARNASSSEAEVNL